MPLSAPLPDLDEILASMGEDAFGVRKDLA